MDTPQLNKTQSKKLDTFSTMSGQIKYLKSKDYSVSEISRILSRHHQKLVRYQWVRNVLTTPVKNPKESIS